MDLRELATAGTQRHPWELARADFFCELLARRVLDHRIERVVDVGAGDAFFARRLSSLVGPRTEIVCVDPNYDFAQIDALSASLPPSVRLERALPAGRADLILMLDVLEHVADDGAQLGQWVAQHLSPDGFVLMSVPAWPSLFSHHDTLLAHHRRYTPSAARSLLEGSGLRVLASGGAFHALLPLRLLQVVWWASARRAKLRGAVEPAATDLARWHGGEALTRLALGALKLDNALSKWAAARQMELPGLSWWALCQNTVA